MKEGGCNISAVHNKYCKKTQAEKPKKHVKRKGTDWKLYDFMFNPNRGRASNQVTTLDDDDEDHGMGMGAATSNATEVQQHEIEPIIITPEPNQAAQLSQELITLQKQMASRFDEVHRTTEQLRKQLLQQQKMMVNQSQMVANQFQMMADLENKLRNSIHGRALNKVIKKGIETPNLQSPSRPHNGIHVENKPKGRKLIWDDDEDTFDDEMDAAATQKWDWKIKPRLAEPIMTPAWQGKFLIQFGKYTTDMEIVCYLSTKSSSKVTEAVKVLPSTVTFAVKCTSDVWPRRFHMSTLSDKAVAVYFLPKNDKDENAYNEILDYEIKHKLALFYEIPAKNQNLLIFPSVLLPLKSFRLQKKYYMWGAFDEKGR